MDCLREERSDWLAQSREVQVELERNSEERANERVEQAAKVQEMTEQLQKQSKVSIMLPPPGQEIHVAISCPISLCCHSAQQVMSLCWKHLISLCLMLEKVIP